MVKLNGKTNLIKTAQRDPFSSQWHTLEQVTRFREQSGLRIVGVGFTIYPGSEFEHDMLQEATRLIFDAHQAGLPTILWAYPRGKAVDNELDPHLIAGVTGLASDLGTDFVKVNYPKVDEGVVAERFKEAVAAAGRTKVICAGGKEVDAEEFLSRLHDQIHISGSAGNATGRNIHQLPLDEAVRFCNAVYAVSVENKSVAEALAIYQGA